MKIGPHSLPERIPGLRKVAATVFAVGFFLAASAPVYAQKIGLTDPFDAPWPRISFGYTYFDGAYDAPGTVTVEGNESDRFRLKQHIVGVRVSQQVFSRLHVHADGGIAENRLDGSRFESGTVYGGGIQVLLHDDPNFYLLGVGQGLVHDTVELRRDSSTELEVRNDWQAGFIIGSEGDRQPLLGDEITGSRTYIGVLYSAREFDVRSDRTESFEHRRLAGLIGLIGIQLDVGNRFGVAAEGHAGAATGGSGWIYYQF
jgi:hypothetical protein